MNKRNEYKLLDVFTEEAYGGNPLAVFPKGSTVKEEHMQRFAKELNLSETTYVLPPVTQNADFQVRIFTPQRELPMAGHPTIGTAICLYNMGVRPKNGQSFIFDEGVGPVEVKLEEGKQPFFQMKQPKPEFGPQVENRKVYAEMLGLDEEHLDVTLPIEQVSCGVKILIIPIKNLEAIGKAKLNERLWLENAPDAQESVALVFTSETVDEGSDFHVRCFAPHAGIPEDPATGGANGPLACYLAKNKVTKSNQPYFVEQGVEMGRPSQLRIEAGVKDDEFIYALVSGTAVEVGEGALFS